jgi:hypothetical protein
MCSLHTHCLSHLTLHELQLKVGCVNVLLLFLTGACASVTRDLLWGQKRPAIRAKETYYVLLLFLTGACASVKRDLVHREKRPSITIPFHIQRFDDIA